MLKYTNEEAFEAVRAFHRIVGGLETFARHITGNPELRVHVTDGTTVTVDNDIFIRPPLGLGVDRIHDRSHCGRRDENYKLMCDACDKREVIDFQLFHEVAHVAKGSQNKHGKKTLKYYREYLKEWHPVGVCTHAVEIDSHREARMHPVGIGILMNPYMGFIVNALEDARVNESMFADRGGLRDIFFAQMHRLMIEDFDLHGVPHRAKETPKDFQFILGAMALAMDYDITQFILPEIQTVLADNRIRNLTVMAASASSADETFRLSYELFKVAQDLGYCVVEKCVPIPVEPENDENESDDSDNGHESELPSLNLDPSLDPGDDVSSDDSSGLGDSPSDESEKDDPSEGESSGTDDSDSGDETEEDNDAGHPSGETDSTAGDDSNDESDPSRGDEPSTGEDDGDDSLDDNSVGSSSASEDADAGSDDRTEESRSAGDPVPSQGITGTGHTEETDEGVDANLDSYEIDTEEVQPDGTNGELGERQEGQSNESAVEPDLTDLWEDELLDRLAGNSSESSPNDPPSDPVSGLESPDPSHGDPSDIESLMEHVLTHGLIDNMVEGELEDLTGSPEGRQLPLPTRNQLKEAIKQALDFEEMSLNVGGIEVIDWPRYTRRHVWAAASEFAVAEYMPEPGLLARPMLVMRRAFDVNKQARLDANRKSGRINTNVLGKRAPLGDPRLFGKKTRPGRKSYAVVILVDCSYSTHSDRRIEKEIRMVFLEAEMLQQIGIPFEIVAHSGGRASNLEDGDYNKRWIYVQNVKKLNEPWGPEQKSKLAGLQPVGANLDGHMLEYARKIIDQISATDRIVQIFTDGQMPQENYEEEREILLRELDIMKRNGTKVLGVGINTDSPLQYGLNTVRVDSDEDIIKVVDQLEAALLEDKKM